MSLQSFKKVIGNGKKLVAESAAVTNELTKEMMKDPTVFTIPSDGINKGTLLFKLRSAVGPSVAIDDTNGGFTVTTTNPVATHKILKQLGLVTDTDGGNAEDLQSNPDDIASQGSDTGTIGESWTKRVANRFKKYLK